MAVKRKTKKRALVTGGGGFIGSHLIKELQQRDYNVYCLDRSERVLPNGVPNFKGDILDEKIVNKAMKNMDVVYHLAGILGTSELQETAVEAIKINVIGALNIYNAAVKNNTRVVLISKPNVWLNTYSITKETSEKFLQMYQKDFGLKGCIVKWHSVYGPAQKHYGVRKAVPTLIVQALEGKPLTIYGNGRQRADFVYVTDTVNATVRFAENKKSEGLTAEIGGGIGTTVNRIAKIILKQTNSKSKIKYLPMRIGEDEDTKLAADLTVLKKIIKFEPKINLEEGLKLTIDYYKNLLSK